MRSTEDRRRIVQLLQLAEPIEQTIKLYYDRRPEKLEKYAITDSQPYDPTSVALSKSVKSIGSGKRKNTPSSSAGKFNYRIPPSDEKQQIIRTVMFPNNNSSNGSNEEEVFLKKQIEELKNMYELQIMKMEEDRRMREEEFRLQNLNSKDKIEDLLRKNQKLEKLNYEITKDFMQLKYESSLNEKKLYEEMESLRTQGESLAQRLNEVTNKTKAEKESKKGEYERKASEIARVMRSQVKSQEENLNIMKEQYKQIQKVYNDKVKDLESKLKNLTEKCKNMENKRNYEIEGYINEIKLMRQRLKSYEDYVSKLRRMTEGGVDRYTQINEVTRTNNSEFLADTKKTKVSWVLN